MRPFPTQQLVHWFQKNARHLPWRQNPTPYQVLISEIMLQQTQVSVVIPYFIRWMDHFPSIETLAKADLQHILKIWEGLGYYSRAKNLHLGAKHILSKFQGKIPSNENDLSSIPGLGPYTTAAIQNFAFHKRCPVIDGNVKRVIARFDAIKDNIDRKKTVHTIENTVKHALPENEPWQFSEALIELGALVCKKKPLCHTCPLQCTCLAYQKNLTDELPKKTPRKSIIKLDKQTVILEAESSFLLMRGQDGKALAHLYHFPLFPKKPFDVMRAIEDEWNAKILRYDQLQTISHSYTNHRVTLIPWHIVIKQKVQVNNAAWHPKHLLQNIPFCAGHRKIKNILTKY